MSVGIPQQVINEAAAHWDVLLRSHRCTDQDRDNFNHWLKADTAHQAAYERLQTGLATLRAAGDHPQLRALREIASLVERREKNRHHLSVWAAVAGIAAVALAVGLLAWHRPHVVQVAANIPATTSASDRFSSETLLTSTTERRTIALQDGSSVTLDGASQIETEWLPHERRVRLLSGRALFRVSKDKTRPFIVTVGDRTVTALGTAFDIHLDADKVQVTLLEGRVAVRGVGKAASEPMLELVPNQQLVAIEGHAATVQRVDGLRESGWAEGQVYFADETLAAAVAEMNQHSALQLVIADPTLETYRLNGMFRADNQEGFVTALTDYFPIDARADGAGHIVLRSRSRESSSH
jgi:transmembrane sensor